MTDSDSIESWVEKARKAYTAGDYVLAGKLFLDVSVKFEDAGRPLDAAEMRNNSSVALLKAGKAGEALTTVMGTPDIFERVGDHKRQAMALANQAAAHEEMRHLDEALRNYKQAAELLKDSSADDMRSLILKRITAIQIRIGKPIHALAAMDTAIEVSQKRSFGDRLIRSLMAIIRKLLGQT